jgi:hypothetical protein
MLKGQLFSHFSDLNVVDITHSVELANTNQTAFLLKNSFRSFPEGTIHFVLTGVSRFLLTQPVVMQIDGHYFIGDDNGVFALIANGIPDVVTRQYTGDTGDFLEKMISLAESCFDGRWQELTEPYQFQVRIPFSATYIESQNMISGHITYIDAYNNVLTNIPISLFEERVHDGNFFAKVGNLTITNYHRTYETDPEPYLVPNCLGVLEIASYRSRISILAKWQKDTSVDIFCYRHNS